jgi:hypothetical protein
MLPSDPNEAFMPSLRPKLADDHTRYSIAQLVQLRRQMLRFARSLPRGSNERIERRQIAASLRSLLKQGLARRPYNGRLCRLAGQWNSQVPRTFSPCRAKAALQGDLPK